MHIFNIFKVKKEERCYVQCDGDSKPLSRLHHGCTWWFLEYLYQELSYVGL